MNETAFKWLMMENLITIIVAGVVVIVLYWLSGSMHSLWALLILANCNTFKTRRKGE